MSQSDKSTRAERKEVYDAVLRTVSRNTGDPMPPGQSVMRLKTILCANGRFESEGVEKAAQAAVENGDLIKWPGVPYRDAERYTRTETEDLRELLGSANRWQSELKETIETAADAIQEATGDG